MIINVKTFYKLQQSEYYENGIWSILLLCPVLDYLFGTLAYIVYGKKIKPFYVMLLWHISATRRHSKIFLWIMPTCKMISQHATLLYIYITKNCNSMSLFSVFYCCLLSYHLANLLFMQHIYLAWSTFNFNPIQTIQL